jgi:DNA-binding response OmpR family regulator
MTDETTNKMLMAVDDEPELLDLLQEYLGRHGFEMCTAPNAAHARELVMQRVPDLAILDVNMPGENGLSLARWLRETYPGMGLVMLTTAGEMIDRVVGLEVGADDYLPKPFELRDAGARARRASSHFCPCNTGRSLVCARPGRPASGLRHQPAVAG